MEFASNASRLRMPRTCHESDVAWVSQVTMLDGATVNLAGVADVSAGRMLQLALGARTGDQLDEAMRIGPRARLRYALCVEYAFFADDRAGLRLAVAISVSEVHSNAGRYCTDALTWMLRWELRSCVAMFLRIARLPWPH